MNYINAYIAAFQRCYPQKRVEIKTHTRNGVAFHKVVINGESGDKHLTEYEMRVATRDFGGHQANMVGHPRARTPMSAIARFVN